MNDNPEDWINNCIELKKTFVNCEKAISQSSQLYLDINDGIEELRNDKSNLVIKDGIFKLLERMEHPKSPVRSPDNIHDSETEKKYICSKLEIIAKDSTTIIHQQEIVNKMVVHLTNLYETIKSSHERYF